MKQEKNQYQITSESVGFLFRSEDDFEFHSVEGLKYFIYSLHCSAIMRTYQRSFVIPYKYRFLFVLFVKSTLFRQSL